MATSTTTTKDDGSPTPTRAAVGTKCIILCPTRELAAQTVALAERVCAQTFHWIVPGSLLGSGAGNHDNKNKNHMNSRKSEKMRLRKGLGIVVATPGRLLDHLCKTESLLLALKTNHTNKKNMKKSNLEWLVLDEADRLLDMGLGEQVQHIVQRILANQGGSTRTTSIPWRSVLVSATVTPSVQQLAIETLALGNSSSDSWIWIRSKQDDDKDALSTLSTAAADIPQQQQQQPKQEASSNLSKQAREDTAHDGAAPDKKDQDVDDDLPAGELADSTPRQLAQWHMTVSAKWRLSALIALLVQRVVQQQNRVVVFLDTCASVDFYYALFQHMDCIVANLNDDDENNTNNNNNNKTTNKNKTNTTTQTNSQRGIFGSACSIYKLHGRVPHAQRQQVLHEFLQSSDHPRSKYHSPDVSKPASKNTTTNNNKAAILLATDVAARGLNLEQCDWTVQYDPPAELSDYVHRAGRVARAGKAGHSLLFLLPSEREFLLLLKQRGIAPLPALSLSATLMAAATKSCPTLTQAGVQRTGGGTTSLPDHPKTNNNHNNNTSQRRLGEAFSIELQHRLEECVLTLIDPARSTDEVVESTSRNPTSTDTTFKKKQSSKKQQQGKQQQQQQGSDLFLLELARTAFLSHIRAYPTREKCVKHVFAAKALHLGHVARSFALRETPKHMGASFSSTANRTNKKNNNNSNKSTPNTTPTVETTKRNAALAFEWTNSEVGGDEPSTMAKTKKHKRNNNNKRSQADTLMGESLKKNARSIMMENANKLHGMDAF